METGNSPEPPPIIVELPEAQPHNPGESPLTTAYEAAYGAVEALAPYVDDAIKTGLGAAALGLVGYGVYRGGDWAQGRLDPTSSLGKRYGEKRMDRLEKKKAKHAPAAADVGNDITGYDADAHAERVEDKARAALVTQSAGWKDLEYVAAIDDSGDTARDSNGRMRVLTARKRPAGASSSSERPRRDRQTRTVDSGSRGVERNRRRDGNGDPIEGMPRDSFRGGLLGKIPGVSAQVVEPLRRNANARRSRAVHRDRNRGMENHRSGDRKRETLKRVMRGAGIRKDKTRIGFSSNRSAQIDNKIEATRIRHGL